MSAAKMFDVDDIEVARIYADAAWNAALKSNAGDELADELDAVVRELVDKSPRFEAFLQVGTIKSSDRRHVLDRAFRGQVGDLCFRLLSTLNQHDRLSSLRAVAARMRQLASQRKGVKSVLVRTAKVLSDSQRTRIQSLLRKNLNAEPEMETVVDPDLIGGLQIIVGETVYDYSVRQNLERLHEGILTRSSNEIQSR